MLSVNVNMSAETTNASGTLQNIKGWICERRLELREDILLNDSDFLSRAEGSDEGSD